MNTPEQCPKCGCDKFVDLESGREFTCFTLILKDGTPYDGNQCLRTQRDQLAERVREITTELRRADDRADRAEERVKRLEEAGDELADCIGCGCIDGGCKICREFEAGWNVAKDQP